MWAPKLAARVLQELNASKTDRVLEIGTGSGYLTALLSHRAAHVFSVEIKPKLAAFGRANLERHGAENVTLEIGDATSSCSPARRRSCRARSWSSSRPAAGSSPWWASRRS